MRSQDRRTQGKRFKASDLPAHDYDLDYPVFCLRHVDHVYCITGCSEEQKASFLQTMRALSQPLGGKFFWQAGKVNTVQKNYPKAQLAERSLRT
jgi:hypothetical protein